MISLLMLLLMSNEASASHVYCIPVMLKSSSMDQVLKKPHRPTVIDLMKLNLELDPVARKSTKEESQFYDVTEAIVREILETSDGNKIFVLARDADFIQDALQVTLIENDLDPHAVGRINLSREAIGNVTNPQVLGYLRAQGIDIEGLLNGTEKITLIDTGNRGNVFLRILEAITSTIDKNDSQWKVKIRNLLLGVNGRLAISAGRDTRSEVLDKLDGMSQFSLQEVSNLLNRHLFFSEILEHHGEKLNIPESRHARSAWAEQVLEHRPHFTGQSHALSSDGTKVVGYGIDSRVDRSESVAAQLRLIHYFRDPQTKYFLQDAVEVYKERLSVN